MGNTLDAAMYAKQSDNELFERSEVLRLKSEMLIRRQNELHAEILRLVQIIRWRSDAIRPVQLPSRRPIN